MWFLFFVLHRNPRLENVLLWVRMYTCTCLGVAVFDFPSCSMDVTAASGVCLKDTTLDKNSFLGIKYHLDGFPRDMIFYIYPLYPVFAVQNSVALFVSAIYHDFQMDYVCLCFSRYYMQLVIMRHNPTNSLSAISKSWGWTLGYGG